MSGGKNAKASRNCLLKRAKSRRKVKDIVLKNQKTGEIVTIDIVEEFCREKKLIPSNVIEVINGNRTSAKFWTLPNVTMKFWILEHKDGLIEKVFENEGRLFEEKYNLPRRSFGSIQSGYSVNGWLLKFIQPTVNGKGRTRKRVKNIEKILSGDNRHTETPVYIKDLKLNEIKVFFKKRGYISDIVKEFPLLSRVSAERLANNKVGVCANRFVRVETGDSQTICDTIIE
jgi:hypothetical protein